MKDLSKKMANDYPLIPMDEIDDEARLLAVRWHESATNWIGDKHKLASDIMNYARRKNQKSELSDKLKMTVAKTYQKYGDKKALLIRGNKTFTGVEVSNEIIAETETGIQILEGMIQLAIDLVKRDKINFENET